METAFDRKPLVSIIMPTYNRALFIRETIESIQQQTYPVWELIIIDDGSTDDTEKVVKMQADERIIYLRQSHSGIGGKTKNIGLNRATGEFYAFIDSDDLWAPEKLERQLTLLMEDRSLGFCLVGGYNFREKGLPIENFYPERTGIKKGKLFQDFFRSALPAFTQAVMLRRECLETIGHFKEEKSFSDLDFLLELAFHFEGAVLYDPLFFRRLHPGNYINSTWEKSYREGIAVIDEYYQKGKISKGLRKLSLFNVYINFGEDWLLHNDSQAASRYFVKAWRLRPFNIIPLKKSGKALLSIFKKTKS